MTNLPIEVGNIVGDICFEKLQNMTDVKYCPGENKKFSDELGTRACETCILPAYLKLVSNFEEANEQALYDYLTGLPNKRFMYNELNKKINEGDSFTVLLLDIKGFKQVNDSLTHQDGDDFLVKTANLFNEFFNTSLREGDFVARGGGDEFYIILNNFATFEPCNQKENFRKINNNTDKNTIDNITKRLLLAFESSEFVKVLNDKHVKIPLSLHINSAVWCSGMTIKNLLKLADPDKSKNR